MSLLKRENKNDNLDTQSLNEVITLSKRILKILFIVIIIVGVYGITILMKELGIINFVIGLLKIVSPLFIGLVIAWLFNPLVKKLQKKGVRRGLSAALIYLVIIIFIALLVNAILPILFKQINDLVSAIPSTLNNVEKWLNGFFSNFSDNSSIDFNTIKNEILIKIEEFGLSLASNLPSIVVNAAKTSFSGIGTILIGFIIGFFLLVGFDGTDKVMSFMPKNIRQGTFSLLKNIEDALRKYVQGTLTLSTLVFLVSSLGFAISGLQSSLLFGVFCGITNIIPYVGPYIGAAPAILVGFSGGGPGVGIGVFITVVVVQLIEGNILNPIVMSKTMKLHPVTIILGLLVFSHFWGIIGMILATPIIATSKVIFKYINSKYKILNINEEEQLEE